MLILTIRTDKPEAEIGLYDDDRQLEYEIWTAHRALGQTIHSKIADLLQKSDKTLSEVQAIAAYRGPGSFTGLRIGLTVANTLASSLPCKLVGVIGTADDAGSVNNDWISEGIERLLAGDDDRIAMPEYGGEIHITLPRK